MRIVWFIVFLFLAGAAYFGWLRAEKDAPVISTLTTPGYVSSEYHHVFRFEDAGSGIRNARVWLVANGKTTELAAQEYPGNALSGAELDLQREVEVVVKPKEMGLADGEVTLHAEATDYSWLSNTAAVDVTLNVDTHPPKASLVTGLTYVRRGGSELAVYSVGDDVDRSGILVGERFFPGFKDPADPKRMIAFYAIPADAPADAKPILVAADKAGNETKIALVATILDRAFPADKIPLTDQFMTEKVAEILPGTDGSPLDGYLKINREVRK